MNYSDRFWDRIAHRYARTPLKHEDLYRQKIDMSHRYLSASMNVLEFGCGTGSTALIHAPHVARYTAIDVSTNMIDIARQKLTDSPIKNLHFARSPLEEWQAEPGTYDAILGLSILHLLSDPSAAIQRVYQLLKPGGVFISNTACLQDTMPYIRWIEPIARRLGLMPAVSLFSRQWLEQTLESSGFCLDYRWIPDATPDVYFIVASKTSDS